MKTTLITAALASGTNYHSCLRAEYSERPTPRPTRFRPLRTSRNFAAVAN